MPTRGQAARLASVPDPVPEKKEEESLKFFERLHIVISQLRVAFVARNKAIRAICLALLTRNNFLLVGDPGTGKTALIDRFVRHIEGARHFQALCGSFTTLDEIVGPVDIQRLKKGEIVRRTDGMLPDSEIAFLDEVMKSNDGTLNSLLSILNERRFNGADLPLHVVGAATNWPEIDQRTEKVEALYDRFVLRHHVEDVEGEDRAKMLRATMSLETYKPHTMFTLDELKDACDEVRKIDVSDQILRRVADFCAKLAEKNIRISGRRAGKAVRILQASAWLRGASSVSLDDFDDLRFVFWSNEKEIQVVDALLSNLDGELIRQVKEETDELFVRFNKFMRRDGEAVSSSGPELLLELVNRSRHIRTLIKKEGATSSGLEVLNDDLTKLSDIYIIARDRIAAIAEGGS